MTCRWPAFVLLTAIGCGDSTKAAIDQQVANWREVAIVLQSVQDDATMNEAEDRLASLSAKHKAGGRAFQKIARGPASKLDAYPDEKAAMEAAVRDVLKELRRIKSLPGGEDFFKRLSETVGSTP